MPCFMLTKTRAYIREKYKVARNEKQNKIYTIWIFIFQKYGKFWRIPLGHFIKHKHLISEEWNRLEVLMYYTLVLWWCPSVAGSHAAFMSIKWIWGGTPYFSDVWFAISDLRVPVKLILFRSIPRKSWGWT